MHLPPVSSSFPAVLVHLVVCEFRPAHLALTPYGGGPQLVLNMHTPLRFPRSGNSREFFPLYTSFSLLCLDHCKISSCVRKRSSGGPWRLRGGNDNSESLHCSRFLTSHILEKHTAVKIAPFYILLPTCSFFPVSNRIWLVTMRNLLDRREKRRREP